MIKFTFTRVLSIIFKISIFQTKHRIKSRKIDAKKKKT